MVSRHAGLDWDLLEGAALGVHAIVTILDMRDAATTVRSTKLVHCAVLTVAVQVLAVSLVRIDDLAAAIVAAHMRAQTVLLPINGA